MRTAELMQKAAWKIVSKPKNSRGLSVLDLQTHNEALPLKNLHKFFNKADIPWVQLIWKKYYSNDRLPSRIKKGSFWWRDVMKLLDKFKGMASANVANGKSCLLWDDCWSGQPWKLSFPKLYSFARKPALTLYNVINSDPLYLCKPTSSSRIFKRSLVLYRPWVTLCSPQNKPIVICLVTQRLIQSSNEFGNHHAT